MEDEVEDMELDELERRAAHIKALEGVIGEFLGDVRVCQAIGSDCIGSHQEDPCKCLYCRAKKTLSED
jgi:hypothetical protein